MAAPAHPCARGIPFILNIKSSGSSTTWVEPSRKGRREIGIRVALGANARRIELMVVRRGLAYALGGTMIGIILAVFLTRGLESLLYDVERTDPPTLIGACAVLLVIALVASWLPARRATRVHPMEALRDE